MTDPTVEFLTEEHPGTAEQGDGRQTRYVTVRAADPVLAAKLRDPVRAALSERLSRPTRT